MIVIIGGGIIGLSIGWTLVQAGRPVTILERGQVGQAATWAAAGILAPWGDPQAGDVAFLKLQQASHALWPDFVAQVQRSSGMQNLGYRTEGRLFISLDHEDAAGLKEQYEFNRRHGVTAEWLSGAEARQLEPNLSPAVTNAVYMPGGYQIDNRQTALALRQAFLLGGGALREQTAVQEIVIDQGRVRGVRAAGEMFPAETVIAAAGAWTSHLTGLSPDVCPPVRPVKGQMLAVDMPAGEPLLRHIVTGEAYLIPRLDGRLLVGATVEEQGFNTEVTVAGVFYLLDKAQSMLPSIRHRPIVETWAGLRPASADDRPVLGLTRVEGLILATGLYRHGILLAPVTAQAIGQVALNGQVPALLKPFAPDRFL